MATIDFTITPEAKIKDNIFLPFFDSLQWPEEKGIFADGFNTFSQHF